MNSREDMNFGNISLKINSQKSTSVELHKCKVQIMLLVYVSINLRTQTCPQCQKIIIIKRESSSKPKQNTKNIHAQEKYKHENI